MKVDNDAIYFINILCNCKYYIIHMLPWWEKQNQLTPQTRKHTGSRKVEGYCVSRMMVTRENNGKVSYIRTRTPGISEAKHLPLPLTVKQEVREKV